MTPVFMHFPILHDSPIDRGVTHDVEKNSLYAKRGAIDIDKINCIEERQANVTAIFLSSGNVVYVNLPYSEVEAVLKHGWDVLEKRKR